jgi:prepilin-type N-terminal cleavage/methylation domain-containing protein
MSTHRIHRKHRDHLRNRRGVSLIEVMVAVTLLGLIATVQTVATMRLAIQNRQAAVGVSRATAMTTAADFFSTMPPASIAGNLGCATLTLPANYPHTRCVTSTAVNAAVERMQIIITPTNTAFRPDTVIVDRVTTSPGSVFQ